MMGSTESLLRYTTPSIFVHGDTIIRPPPQGLGHIEVPWEDDGPLS